MLCTVQETPIDSLEWGAPVKSRAYSNLGDWKVLEVPASEYVRPPEPAARHRANLMMILRDRGSYSDSWYGKGPVADLVRVLRGEMPYQGAEHVVNLTRDLDVPALMSMRRRPSWSHQGTPNLDRAMNGWDTPFRAMERAPGVATSPVVELAVRGAFSGLTTEAHMYWTGAAALALNSVLELSGRRVGISAYVTARRLFTSGAQRHHCIKVRLKEAHELVDPGTLAARLCLPAFFRVFDFCWCSAHDRRISAGMGGAVDPSRSPLFDADREIEVPEITTQKQAQDFLRTVTARWAR